MTSLFVQGELGIDIENGTGKSCPPDASVVTPRTTLIHGETVVDIENEGYGRMGALSCTQLPSHGALQELGRSVKRKLRGKSRRHNNISPSSSSDSEREFRGFSPSHRLRLQAQ